MLTIPKFLPEPEKEPTTRAARAASRKAVTRESQVETYLIRRVKELGGEVRKVEWIGRNSAPDRIVMLPERYTDAPSTDEGYIAHDRTIWIEVKAPGKGATFPANAHERAQHREHERMRKMGQRVEVVDSLARVDEVLK